MKVVVTFEDHDKVYTLDFLKLAKKLKITDQDVKKAVLDLLAE